MWAPSNYSQHQSNFLKIPYSVTHGEPKVSQIYKDKALPVWPFPVLSAAWCPTSRSFMHSVCSWRPLFTVLANPTLRNSFMLEAHLTSYLNSYPKVLNFALIYLGRMKDLEGREYIMLTGFDSISGSLLLILVLLLLIPQSPRGPQFPQCGGNGSTGHRTRWLSDLLSYALTPSKHRAEFWEEHRQLGLGRPRLQTWLCHTLAMWFGTNYLISLRLYFLFHEVENKIKIPAHVELLWELEKE